MTVHETSRTACDQGKTAKYGLILFNTCIIVELVRNFVVFFRPWDMSEFCHGTNPHVKDFNRKLWFKLIRDACTTGTGYLEFLEDDRLSLYVI